jgi:hypothetical protein
MYQKLDRSFMTNPSRDKAEFDDWIGGIISNLNLRAGSADFSAENLEKVHWKRIWEIYDRCKVELSTTRTKEIGLVWESASDEAQSITLQAHNTDDSEFLQTELMEHYMNSGNYD